MYRVTSIIPILFFCFESGSAALCLRTKDPLCTLAQWRDNLECRINGGAGSATNTNGYLSRFLESVATTREEQALKTEILVSSTGFVLLESVNDFVILFFHRISWLTPKKNCKQTSLTARLVLRKSLYLNRSNPN